MRTFNTYVSGIFLYNSETWSLNKTLESQYAIGIYWPKMIKNIDLYDRTKCEPLSKTIRRRRLNLVGHMMRLPEEAPVKIALKETLKECKNRRRRPSSTWLKTVKNDLQKVNIDIREQVPGTYDLLRKLTGDRNDWKRVVSSVLMQF